MIKYTNDYKMSYKDLTVYEQIIYNEQIIKNESSFLHSVFEINYKKISQRKTDFIYDKLYNLPQTIFTIKYKKYKILGRKIRSILSIEDKINAINCSRITASMILGILKCKNLKNRDISVEYYPMTEQERSQLFNEIKQDSTLEIVFPFQERLFDSNQVEKTDKKGWSLNPKKAEYLGYGEEHLRRYTNNIISDIVFNGCRIYDPACSTGQFLYNIKTAFPSVVTIGGDLSKQMIDYAKDYLDIVECCNAKDSQIQENSVDIMFLRFLNDQVVSKFQAKYILSQILKKVKKDGFVIAFGHTPVLLTKRQFGNYGLLVDTCIAYDAKEDDIFQYYIMRKIYE